MEKERLNVSDWCGKLVLPSHNLAVVQSSLAPYWESVFFWHHIQKYGFTGNSGGNLSADILNSWEFSRDKLASRNEKYKCMSSINDNIIRVLKQWMLKRILLMCTLILYTFSVIQSHFKEMRVYFSALILASTLKKIF